MPTWIGLAIVFVSFLGESANRRYPGLLVNADRDVFPRGSDE
jgi:hypothetical protein